MAFRHYTDDELARYLTTFPDDAKAQKEAARRFVEQRLTK